MNHSDSLPVYIESDRSEDVSGRIQSSKPGIVDPQAMHHKLRYQRTASASLQRPSVTKVFFAIEF
jgi:hypothetical protein